MRPIYVISQGGEIHYRHEGSGEVLLLLHMAGGVSDQYERVAPFLSRNYDVIAPDYMGFGESDNPPSAIRNH